MVTAFVTAKAADAASMRSELLVQAFHLPYLDLAVRLGAGVLLGAQRGQSLTRITSRQASRVSTRDVAFNTHNTEPTQEHIPRRAHALTDGEVIDLCGSDSEEDAAPAP